MASLPDFIVQRNKLYAELKEKHDAELQQREKPEINVELDSGAGGEMKVFRVKAWEATPGSLLKHLDKAEAAEIVVAKTNGALWDLDRPFEQDCRVRLIPFSAEEGRKVFWHSSAHILGEACEMEFDNCLLSHGPPVDEGFFYDMAIESGRVVKDTDKSPLEKRSLKFLKEKQKFERLHVSLQDLKQMFGYSKYKMHYIENLLPPEGSTVYRCGDLVDLCLGPHIQNSNKIKAFKVMKNSSCYFLGDKNNDSLQRIYGVAFPEKKLLDAHLKMLEEAAKRDHRRIGRDQKLFTFFHVAPGCPFLSPHGSRIFNALQKLLRKEYFNRGYDEVQSPNMYDVDLWKTSGHWAYYQNDIFKLKVEEREWALKPMNCPGHCMFFKDEERSYKELPLRLADFGVLHRNEASGALSGLTRVRKFQQDDAHIFCRMDQVTDEIQGLFDFLKAIYGLFGFTFKLKLSTRPEKYLGDIAEWDAAEDRLTKALNNFSAQGGGQWELNEGDGAFYGPKIDIEISDALGRGHQCATIQLDFNLPRRFGLHYMTGDTAPTPEQKVGTPVPDPKASKPPNEDGPDGEKVANNAAPPAAEPKEPLPGYARPVMLHRAIIGSFERFMAIITEHFGGKWPFWLSPRQVLVIPVMPQANDYVLQVQQALKNAKLYADVDIGGNTMQKKILRGQQAQYNFILVVGSQERESRSVNIRNRDDQKTQSKGELVPLDTAVTALKRLKKERRLESSLQLGAKESGAATSAGAGTELEKDQAERIKQLEEELEAYRVKTQGAKSESKSVRESIQ